MRAPKYISNLLFPFCWVQNAIACHEDIKRSYFKSLVNFKTAQMKLKKRILPYCGYTFFLDIKEMRAEKFPLLSLWKGGKGDQRKLNTILSNKVLLKVSKSRKKIWCPRSSKKTNAGHFYVLKNAPALVFLENLEHHIFFEIYWPLEELCSTV